MNEEELLNFLALKLEEGDFVPYQGLEAEKIMELERELGFELPNFFRLFYLNFNGGESEDEVFYPLTAIPQVIKELNIPKNYLPFFLNALEQIFLINPNGEVFCLDEGQLESLDNNFSNWIFNYWE